MSEHEAFWRALTLGPAAAAPESLLDAVLSQSSLSEDDRRFLVEQGPVRLVVYRRLVRNNLRDMIALAMPRALARLEALEGREPGRSAFAEAFDAFCSERGPRSHYLRDVTLELLDYLEACAGAHALPRHLLELGRLEAAAIEVAAAPNRRELRSDLEAHHEALQGAPRSHGDELELERGVAFCDACRLFHFEHAVHRLPKGLEDRTTPEAQDTHLLVYRSPEHEVRYLELSPLAAAILRRLLAGTSLRRAIVEASMEARTKVDDALLAGSAQVLAELAERGVLLGAREPVP